MTMRWRGLMAPDDVKTGDRRAFAPGVITHRKLPLPAEWVREKGAGHSGAVTIASIDAVYALPEGLWGTGELLDPMFIPEVTPFAYLAAKGLVGPSVDLDPDMTFTWTPDPDNPEEAIRLITRGNIHGVTFVSTPAFSQVTVEIFDDEEAGALLASAGIEAFAVNGSNWRSWPIADKATPWSADASIARLAAWSGGDGKKYRQAFLYYDAKAAPNVKETYRLPIADVVNDKLVLIPRAVYQAAAFLSGAHGGVKDIPDNEVQPLQRVVTEIYAVLAQAQEDPQLVPPWSRGGRQGAKDSGPVTAAAMINPWQTPQVRLAPNAETPSGSTRPSAAHAASCTASSATAPERAPSAHPTAIASPAEPPTSKSGRSAPAVSRSSASETMPSTTSDPNTTLSADAGPSSSRPTASPVSNTCTCSTSKEAFAPSANALLPEDSGLPSITAPSLTASEGCSVHPAISESDSSAMTISDCAAQPNTSEKEDTMPPVSYLLETDIEVAEDDMPLVASAMDRPPAAWFANPQLTKPTPLEVDENGRVWGHMALWGQCHKAFRHKCIMPPKSHTDYKHFKLGKVLVDDGKMVKVGRVTVGTGHADDRFGVIPAREHYDNTGTCAAVVVPYEDKFGLAVAGATVQGLPSEKVAELRRSPLSGDWRRVNGNLELVGALAVNDPGFEVVSEDEAGVFSLTAAGTFRADELGSEEDCGCAVGEEPRDWSALLAEVDDVIKEADSAAKMAAWEALKE